MIYKLEPGLWAPYVNVPQIENGTLVFRSINAALGGVLVNGVGGYALPPYNPGETLQWALLARTPTPPTVLDIVVAEAGSINNLAVYGINIPAEWAWVVTAPAVIDRYVPTLWAGIPEIGKEIQIQTWLLGDPDSIAAYIQPTRRRLWPWVLAAVTLGVVLLIREKR